MASFAVAGRDRGFNESQREATNLAVGASYRKAMHDWAGMRKLDVWYARLDVDELEAVSSPQIKSGELERFRKIVAKDSIKAFGKLAHRAARSPLGARAGTAG